MVAAAISRGANALVLGCCDFLFLEKIDCFEVLVSFKSVTNCANV